MWHWVCNHPDLFERNEGHTFLHFGRIPNSLLPPPFGELEEIHYVGSQNPISNKATILNLFSISWWTNYNNDDGYIIYEIILNSFFIYNTHIMHMIFRFPSWFTERVLKACLLRALDQLRGFNRSGWTTCWMCFLHSMSIHRFFHHKQILLGLFYLLKVVHLDFLAWLTCH